METMELVHSSHSRDLTGLSDTDIESFFTEAGLDVEVVTHCDDATCLSCFAPANPARAA